jgi:hypothetical protein
MKTYSGTAPLPGEGTVVPLDIVFHLGRTRRFGGWGNPEWTVLHHSMLVSLIWLRRYGPKDVHLALLHDAHEYITGDIPSPVKRAIGEGVRNLEKALDARIYERLDLGPPVVDPRVRVVDLAALFIEAYHGFGPKGTFEHLRTGDWPSLETKMRDEVYETVKLIDPACYCDMCAWAGDETAFKALRDEVKGQK